MKKFLINLFLVFITVNYTVAEGDTLQSIAEKFCHSDCKAQVGDFREGIREGNYDILKEDEVKPGMKLVITYWGDEKDGKSK